MKPKKNDDEQSDTFFALPSSITAKIISIYDCNGADDRSRRLSLSSRGDQNGQGTNDFNRPKQTLSNALKKKKGTSSEVIRYLPVPLNLGSMATKSNGR